MYFVLVNDLLDIGASLTAQRRALGISQRELAEQLGTSQQQIARWETSGYRNASLERVAAAADALQVTGYDLPLAAEAPAVYATAPVDAPAAVSPVQDLGQIAVRLREHGDVLRDKYEFQRLAVFGSFARGEQTPESDVDFLVDVEHPNLFDLASASLWLEEILGRDVDLVRPPLIRERIRDRVLGEAVYVWSAG